MTNICSKCNILTKDNTKIQCEKCNKKYHLRCAGLSKTAYIPTTCWYCYQCQEEILPFINVSVRQIKNYSFNSLSRSTHPNQLRSIHLSQNMYQEPDYSHKCKVCCKNVDRVASAIPCPSCYCLIHKSCSKLKQKDIDHLRNNPNVWECSSCYSNKFPYMKADDIDVILETFNSNWSC